MSATDLFQDFANCSSDRSSTFSEGCSEAPFPTTGKSSKPKVKYRCSKLKRGKDGCAITSRRQGRNAQNISGKSDLEEIDVQESSSSSKEDEKIYPTDRDKKKMFTTFNNKNRLSQISLDSTAQAGIVHSCESSTDTSDFDNSWKPYSSKKMKKRMLKNNHIKSGSKVHPIKKYSKPFPRTAASNWCSTDSGCNEPVTVGEECCATCNPDVHCAARDISFLRMMKSRMIKIEDTLELMYKKFKLHEDNIDEMQERLYIYEFGTPGSFLTTFRFYCALFICTIFPIIIVEYIYCCFYES